MTPQEAQIIRSVFDRLKTMEAPPRDAEAEALVEALMKADPQAGLGLVRALVMTEQARAAAANEAETLRQEVEQMRARTAPQAAPAGGGLFGGLFGGAPQAQMPAAPAPQAGPWGARPQSSGPWDAQPQQPQGGGFWGSALRTGAGVAGGLFAFEAVKSLFGGGMHSGFGGVPTAGLFDQPTTVVNETVNVFQGGNAGAPADAFGSGDPIGDTAWNDGSSFDDGGGFGGDDDSWA